MVVFEILNTMRFQTESCVSQQLYQFCYYATCREIRGLYRIYLSYLVLFATSSSLIETAKLALKSVYFSAKASLIKKI